MSLFASMHRGARKVILVSTVVALMGVSACDSSEERAEEHYQSGLALLEKGDVDRAIVEFRNVFKLNDSHRDARITYARIQRERGLIGDAYAQYLKVAEQSPDDLEALTALSEIAIDSGNWEELQQRLPRLVTLAPDDIKVKAFDNSLKYFQASQNRDDAARGAEVVRAKELIAEDPSILYPYRVVIDDLLRDQKWNEALEQIETALKLQPDDLSLLQLKLGVLQQLGDMDSVGRVLEDMVNRFPDNERIRDTLIAFYVSRENIDGADKLLSEAAAASTETAPTQRYIGFLYQYRGPEAARAEVERVIAEGRLNTIPFQAGLARLRYDAGEKAEAIAALEEISSASERTSDIRNLEIELAQLMILDGNAVGARQLVERILQEDPSHPGATKLKAGWLIQDDETADAIVLLRDSLAKSPQDGMLMTLLAQAYERDGKHELVADMLAQAVEVSNKAPAESLRYARYLISNEQQLPAEQVLIDSLRTDPRNTDILSALGALYIDMKNWSQAETVVRRLKSFDNETARTIAAGLEAKLLASQERRDELLAMLEGLTGNATTSKAAQLAIFRARVESEGPERALEYIDGLLADAPDDGDFRFMRAGTLMMLGRRDEADAIYRKLIDDFPQSDRVWLTLYQIALSEGDRDRAREVLAEGLEKMPERPSLLLLRAEELQRDGKIEEAIALYEQLYDRDTNSNVMANNLASLIADYRPDDESLQRAYSVARRLRGTEVPAFQDTYGWIAHRLGNHEEALPYLEGAAKGLENDVTVQYHLAVSLAANGQNDRALEQFRKTQAMIDAANPPAFADEVKAEIARLESGGNPEPPKQ